MTQSTFVRDIKVKATTSTAVESFSGPREELTLRVSLSPAENKKVKCDTALAKAPDGGIVEIAFNNSIDQSSKTKSIFYQL